MPCPHATYLFLYCKKLHYTTHTPDKQLLDMAVPVPSLLLPIYWGRRKRRRSYLGGGTFSFFSLLPLPWTSGALCMAGEGKAGTWRGRGGQMFYTILFSSGTSVAGTGMSQLPLSMSVIFFSSVPTYKLKDHVYLPPSLGWKDMVEEDFVLFYKCHGLCLAFHASIQKHAACLWEMTLLCLLTFSCTAFFHATSVLPHPTYSLYLLPLFHPSFCLFLFSHSLPYHFAFFLWLL